jgi:hypothetical protein
VSSAGRWCLSIIGDDSAMPMMSSDILPYHQAKKFQQPHVEVA